MPDQAPMPRTARVNVVVYKSNDDEVHRYEVRGVDPEKDILLGEYDTEDEAKKAVDQYEGGDPV
ncbi:hypothetical protein [Phytohalomonas tamaricis]|uniref:hypothetical protein n=1 Tax=Phytohalomonas tamaricis TaxID=2081032 RepID=UPI000D0BDF7D|nr:hypothetical protein [Phytohalomonas tamaricis]